MKLRISIIFHFGKRRFDEMGFIRLYLLVRGGIEIPLMRVFAYFLSAGEKVSAAAA